MKLDLHDWRNPDSIAKMTDGELFWIITNGKGKMTGGEGDGQKKKSAGTWSIWCACLETRERQRQRQRPKQLTKKRFAIWAYGGRSEVRERPFLLYWVACWLTVLVVYSVRRTCMAHAARFLALVNEAKKSVKETNVAAVKRRMDAGEKFVLVDVREESEWFREDVARGQFIWEKGLSRGILNSEFPTQEQK